ncbi:tetratricopeptide repeat-containing diguanylate cyclase [Andreprevotia chitinilytica]|uniref:tetratricopeptide repeat-containing diguanylate cyclase n=1 Tax=Andreprevotia chitinilytica TaxID=396808 RepID=UPI0005511933|nr:tetratricopeptide repeat-containing diguanylate cyclase [Andreprevotia chitinilytica]
MNADPVSSATVDQLNQRARAMYRDRSDEARSLAEAACKQAIQLDYHFGYVEGLLNHARALLLQGGYQEAIALMRHSLFLGEEYGYTLHVAECLQEIARAHYVLAEYDTALQYWSSCLDVSLNIEAYEAYVRAQIGIGQLYFAHDDFQSAYDHHLKARDGFQHLTDDTLKAAVLINLGVDLHRLGRFDDALEELNAAHELLRRTPHLEYEADTLSGIGAVYLSKHELEHAERYLEQALDINRAHGNLWGEAANLLLLGKLEFARKHEGRSASLLQLALTQAESIGAAHLVYQIEEQLSFTFEGLGDVQRSLHYYRRYHAGYVAILRQASPYKLHLMEMRLEVEKARLENANLRQQGATQRRELQRAEKLAIQDALTGVLNRRGMDTLGEQMFARAREDSQPITALMIDIDHFKRVNDRFGHGLGDTVLRQTAALLKSGCRQDDLVARYGGEEFLIMLPGRDWHGGVELAERLRKLVESWPWSRIHPDLVLTVSVGVADRIADMYLVELLERADRQLYRAKAGGRNQVMVDQPRH